MKRFIPVAVFAAIFFAALSGYLFLEVRLQNTLDKTRKQLIEIASSAALNVTADEVFNIPLNQWSEGTPEYMEVYRKLEQVKAANPSVKYAYIMTTTIQPGILQYVADADPLPEILTSHSPTALPGDKYDARSRPEMLAAYNGPAADEKIIPDAWGIFISAYAPIRDIDGRTAAILGVDTDAAAILKLQKTGRGAGKIALIAGVLFLGSLLTLIKLPNRPVS